MYTVEPTDSLCLAVVLTIFGLNAIHLVPLCKSVAGVIIDSSPTSHQQLTCLSWLATISAVEQFRFAFYICMKRLLYVSAVLFLGGDRLEPVITVAFWDSRYFPNLILSLFILGFSSALGKLSSGWLLVV